MPKRSQTSAPSTPKRKQVKLADGQVRLDRFFSKSPDKRVLPESPGSLDNKTTWSDDEKYAAALAEREGLDLEAIRKLEEEWKQSQRVPDIDAVADTDSLARPNLTAEVEHKSSQTVCESSNDIQNFKLEASTSLRTMGYTSDLLRPPEYTSFSSEPSTFILLEEPWPANTAAPYSFLAHILSAISETRSRITILDTLTNALRTLITYQPLSLLPALYLLSNTISPPYAALELGLGPSIVSKAIQHVSGLGPASIKRLYTLKGDPGDVAFEAKSNLRTLIPHPPLLINAVHTSLLKIATAKGQGATRQKQAIVEKLLVAAKGEEARFLTRTLAQNLRVGASRTSILTALARAMVLTPRPHGSMQEESLYHVSPQVVSQMHAAANSKMNLSDGVRDELKAKYLMAEKLLMRVYVQHPNYEDIVTALLTSGLDHLAERVPLTVGE
jgi:DNA ligase-1